MQRTTTAVLLGLLASTTACTFGQVPGNPFDARSGPTTRLTVSNDHPLDVRIFVLRGQVAMPVARVEGLADVTLELSPLQLSDVGPIRFEIQESAGRERVVTLPVLAGPGHPIHLRVNAGLERSSASVS